MRQCHRSLLFVALAVAALAAPLGAADTLIEKLATCQASWLDWKDNPRGDEAVHRHVSGELQRKRSRSRPSASR